MSIRAVVKVNEGRVCGIKEKSIHSGKEYYAFYGVPFGKPPINRLRFKDPVKVRPWTTVYDATHQKSGCYQFSLRLKDFVGSEDCLYNNIYTPKLPSSDEPLKAVIVNIHPGAFIYGSPDPPQYGSPDYVMHRDIVYVCLGYRLHVFGFLNLGLEDCAGNQGIKDILLGLQWIKENIQFFGGDPENITLIGSSSGAVAIHLLMVLPAAKGLFHKAVIMGMYLFMPVLDTPHQNEELGFRLGYLLGYNGAENDKKALLTFLKAQDAEEIVTKCRSLEKEKYERIAPLFPNGVFETTIDKGKNAILTVPPRNLIPFTSRIPVMFGTCENEAVMGFARGILNESTNKYMKTAFRQNCNGWMHNLTNEQLELVNNEIRSFYLNGAPIEEAPLREQVKIFSDAAFSDVYDTLINLISAELPSSVFVYKFQYEGTLGTLKDEIAPLLPETLEGTFHSCDFGFWCRVDDYRQRTTKSDSVKTREVLETFTKLISTFAKNGDPNYSDLPVQWKPSTPQEPCYLNINDTLEVIDGQLNNERMQFWNKLKKRLMNN